MLRPRGRIPLVLFVLVLATCGGNVDAPGPTTGDGSAWETKEQGVLTACTEIPRPPFAFEEDGKLRGFEIELVQEVARRVGLDAEFKPVSSDRLASAVGRSTCDLAASAIAIGSTGHHGIQFSAGYLEIRQSLLIRAADRARYPTFVALQGATVGVCARCPEAAAARTLASKADVAVQEFKGHAAMAAALRAGEIDGLVQDAVASAYDARTTGETHVAEVFTPSGASYGFLVRKAATRLLDAVNFALADLRADGTYDEIYRRYSPSEEPAA